MWIIPCKFDPERPIVFECVRRIKQTHPGDKIVVVDSMSEDASYTFDLPYDVEIIMGNENYAPNAYHIAFREYPYEDFYYCIHDSMFVNKSMREFEARPLTLLRHFCSPPTGFGWDEQGIDLSIWAAEQLNLHCHISIPEYYYGVFGPIFFAQNTVMQQLVNSGVFNIMCETKFHMSAMERIIGIVLCNLGYNLSTLSLQGEMLDFWDKYDSTYAEKVFLLRP